MSNVRSWLPVVKPSPLNSFPKRLITKWILVINKIIIKYFYKFRHKGANELGFSSNGNGLLLLNADYPLGKKGSIIELPKDLVIYQEVQINGSWEVGESKFLAKCLERLNFGNVKKLALLDIGANSGLVTLQALNMFKTNADVFMFEPISNHVEAIKSNLREHSNVVIKPFALSDRNGKSKIYTQVSNHGNTSLLDSLVPLEERITSEIDLVDTTDFCHKYLEKYDNLVIKCDTQGMDALILSRIPVGVWQKVDSAIIEVWALPVIQEDDVSSLLANFNFFRERSWSSDFNDTLSLKDISDFWLSNSGDSKNLFLRR